MGIKTIILCGLFIVKMTATSFAENFENADIGKNAWADTPRGKFECVETKDHRQMLKLDGKIIYRQPETDNFYVRGGDTLLEGLHVGGPYMDGQCPYIKANIAGYVIYEMPQSGLGMQGARARRLEAYAIINFNATPPTYTELVEFEGWKNDRIPEKKELRPIKKGSLYTILATHTECFITMAQAMMRTA